MTILSGPTAIPNGFRNGRSVISIVAGDDARTRATRPILSVETASEMPWICRISANPSVATARTEASSVTTAGGAESNRGGIGYVADVRFFQRATKVN